MFEQLPNVAGIYAISNKANGDRYVGQAKNIRSRAQSHWRDLNKGTHRTSAARHLQKAWDEFGEENFTLEILEIINDNSSLTDYHRRPDNLSLAEHFYINQKSEYNTDKRIVRSEFNNLIEAKAWRDSPA